MQNKADSSSEINYAFSFHRDRSFIGDRYKFRWEVCSGWDYIARAVLWGAWSPCIWDRGTRGKENFLYSDFLGLDVDDGEPLANAIEMFRDTVHIIGTTRNHQREKKGIIADRYRIIIPWERRITCPRVFEASLAAIGKRIEADTHCYDAARPFWPCTKIVSKIDPGIDLERASVVEPEPPKEYKRRLNEHTGEIVLSKNIINFLTRGLVFGEGRNVSVFVTAKELFSCGQSEHEIIDLIKGAPFERQGFPDREIESTVRSAIKRN